MGTACYITLVFPLLVAPGRCARAGHGRLAGGGGRVPLGELDDGAVWASEANPPAAITSANPKCRCRKRLDAATSSTLS